MRNLIALIWRFNVTVLFLILFLFSFTLLVNNNHYHSGYFYSFINQVSGNTYQAINNVARYLELADVNEKLARENAFLKSKSKFYAYFTMEANQKIINDSLYQQKYEYISAEAINNTIHKRDNYITINKGAAQGIRPEMGVITQNGIVGIVKDVSKNFATVLSLLNSKVSVSAKLKKNDFFGLINWDGKNPSFVQLNDIPNHVQIDVNDTVITRGNSTIFPKGIKVGTISNFEEIEGEEFYNIEVKLSHEFQALSYVYIVKNILRKEQLNLEQKSIDNE